MQISIFRQIFTHRSITIGLGNLIRKPIFCEAAKPRHKKLVLYFTASPLIIPVSLVMTGLLIGCNNIGDRPKDANNQNLSGTWEFRTQDGVKNGTAIFDSKNGIDGDVYVYILSNDLPLGKTAIAGKYKVNNSTNPNQLDFTFGDITTRTIYELSSGQLKIANNLPDQPRPVRLEPQPQQLTKVSDSTNLISDIKILRSPDLTTSSALIREAESKSYIRTIMRSQQNLFPEKGQFSTDINQLASGLNLNSEFYSYKITVLDTGSGLVAQHSAIPLQDGLKAYTGVVYAIASSDANQKATKSLLCESNIPTKAIPANPPIRDDDYRCPDTFITINPY